MDVNGFAVKLQQLERNVDALMNQSFGATSPIAGARQIMTLLVATNTGLINQSIVGPATATVVTNSTTTFQLGRQLNVLTFYRVIADSSGNFAYVNAMMDGAYDANDETILNSLDYANSVMLRVDMLAAGSHTAKLVVDVDAGQTANIVKAQIKVFQLGN